MESALNVLIANIMELQFNEEQVTVQCRVYHWPCAVAFGSFMEKASLTMVSVESYDKVAELASSAAYLYYIGKQWKIGKVAEIPPAKLSNILYCTTCGQHGWKYKWCRICADCNSKKLLALVRVVDGMLITQFVTSVISKGTKVSPAYAVVELIGILRSEK